MLLMLEFHNHRIHLYAKTSLKIQLQDSVLMMPIQARYTFYTIFEALLNLMLVYMTFAFSFAITLYYREVFN